MIPKPTIFEIWAVTLKPAHETVPRAQVRRRVRQGGHRGWPLIPRQDFSNIERQQRGLHSPALGRLRLSEGYEQDITNMHRELDRYLAP